MESRIKNCETQIKGVQSSLRRLNSTFTRVSALPTVSKADVIQVNECYLDSKGLVERFENILFEISQITDATEYDAQCDQFHAEYYKVVGLIKAFLNDHPVELAKESKSDSVNIMSESIKLPSIQVPTFSGKYEDWPTFSDAFTTLIHDNSKLTKLEKFYYLKSSVKAEAAQALKSLSICSENYDAAWKVLKKRYENKRLIINSNLNALFNLDPVKKDSHGMLQKFFDEVQNVVHGLQTYKEPSADTLLIYIVTSKLHHGLRQEWELHCSKLKTVKFEDLTTFMENKCQILGSLEINKANQSVAHGHTHEAKVKTSRAYVSSNSLNCVICKEDHLVHNCKLLKENTPNERVALARRFRLCLNCLKKGHLTKDCRNPLLCAKCGRKHNTLLHLEYSNTNQNVASNMEQELVASDNTRVEPNTLSGPNSSQSGSNSSDNTNTVVCTSCPRSVKPSQVILSTAVVLAYDNVGNPIECRVFLDPGSQSNFISNKMCNRLGLKRDRYSLTISGISDSSAMVNSKTQVRIKSQSNNYNANIDCLVLEKITDFLPIATFNSSALNIPQNICLADPKFNVSREVDMLLGASIFWELLCVGQHKLGRGKPILQKTLLGWIVGGELSHPNAVHTEKYIAACSINNEMQQISKFFELEECSDATIHYSVEESLCEESYVTTTKRSESGRFIVTIPLKADPSTLGNSKNLALKRFQGMETKLIKNPDLNLQYNQFMEEYEKLGHMSKISDEVSDKHAHYYLPHHAVIKNESSTTKLRVVFDASAKTTTNLSLNDIQNVGPAIQGDLFAILLRFRQYAYVLTADIAKMYRQILVNENQRNLQLILWRFNKDAPIDTYRLNTVTYGTASAPYLAVRCLKQLALENKEQFPKAAEIISSDFYVDDLLTGSDSQEELLKIQNEIACILQSAKFELRKWRSNSLEVLNKLAVQGTDDSKVIDINTEAKTLGLSWDSRGDKFIFKYSQLQTVKQVTKRTILSQTAQIFDPLGLLTPITIVPKLIIQRLWQLKLSWDEAVPADVYSQWQQFRQHLAGFDKLKIPRRITVNTAERVELHGFSDASEQAYGACVYLRTECDNRFETNLICSKSRVAPIKTVSIPRLELSGALLLARLISVVKKALKMEFTTIYYWCDSTIVLHWINGTPNKWETFVANRVAEIQRLTDKSNWNHVRSLDNPADIISRGTQIGTLANLDLWWNGPLWLRDNSNWPCPFDCNNSPTVLEARTTVGATVFTANIEFIKNYSSLRKLQRVIAYCQRFSNNCRKTKGERLVGTLHVEELSHSLTTLIRLSQKVAFAQEVSCLLKNQQLPSNSKLLSLNPFLDDKAIVRVGGRLSNGNFNYNKRHPIILPNGHHLTDLIARNEHLRLLHCGPTQLLASLRDTYWPISGRNLTKRIIHECVICYRSNPRVFNPIMGNLPKVRVEACPPFMNTGVDYAGPILVKNKLGRGSRLNKAYICIFVCLSTKALHLDIVSDLSANAFLATLRRFISRRGIPRNMYSDNGTNFVGANSELKKFFAANETQVSIHNTLGQDGINWHFIPSRSPHFGGLWEAGVKSVKRHLYRVLGNTHLTCNEMYTLLTQIESILNSRPLCPLSPDPSDLKVLTPAHFLIGRKLTSVPEPNLKEVPASRLDHYQRLQKIKQHFWARWSKEYVSNLQQRTTWKKGEPYNGKLGDMVLIREDNVPSHHWKLGRISDIHPGTDGIVRVVSVKLPTGNIVKRAVSRLAVLPQQ